MVRVPSEFETDETPVTRQEPEIPKHPVARLIPFVNDEVPDPWIDRMPAVSMLPVVDVLLPTPKPVDTVSWEVDA